MAKVLYSASMSLDGFIAGPGGDMSWLADYLQPNPVLDELIPQVGLFHAAGGSTVRLEPISISQAPQGINVWLRVVR